MKVQEVSCAYEVIDKAGADQAEIGMLLIILCVCLYVHVEKRKRHSRNVWLLNSLL